MKQVSPAKEQCNVGEYTNNVPFAYSTMKIGKSNFVSDLLSSEQQQDYEEEQLT